MYEKKNSSIEIKTKSNLSRPPHSEKKQIFLHGVLGAHIFDCSSRTDQIFCSLTNEVLHRPNGRIDPSFPREGKNACVLFFRFLSNQQKKKQGLVSRKPSISDQKAEK